jgi:hypothetical protein
MTFFIVQYMLALLCGIIASWRMHVPGDRLAPLALGSAVGFFLSAWSATVFLRD